MNIPTILIVDDERDQLDNIKNYLELRIKGNFPSAINGEDAIEYIKNNPCDMMILDIRMPKKSGIEVLDTAKQFPQLFDMAKGEKQRHKCNPGQNFKADKRIGGK